ncbi:uncharacterized protein LOC106137269 [Amyelois transitella]|uniref:uncharacterized protein LOC106137269 n=1 Tax=Amyelois transitella TaxID=680683 RepID=UPI00298FD7B0|nr:uncharacterized protein LOC106137269 [Amyelois transitella]
MDNRDENGEMVNLKDIGERQKMLIKERRDVSNKRNPNSSHLDNDIHNQNLISDNEAKFPPEGKPQTPIQDVNDCLLACKFGRFNIKLLLVTLVGFVSGVSVINTTAFLLPSAECDLNMSLVQKGVLNAIPYLGMLFSSVLAGFLTDTFGRKIFLLIGFGGTFVCSVIAGTSQTYNVLVGAKFFEGLLFASSFSAAVSLSAEFCHNSIRDRIIVIQSSFLALAQVIIAAISWAVLIQDWKYAIFGGYLVLNTWNFYLYIMSLWSLMAFLLYARLPESPKYLVMQREYNKAREILINIYKENTGKPAESYPYKNIWTDEINVRMDENAGSKTNATFLQQIVIGLRNMRPIFQKPLVKYLSVICVINFLTMASHNIISLWFPQVSTVVEHYKSGDQDLCTVLDAYTDDLKNKLLNTTAETKCIPARSGAETYINSMIIGGISIVPILITGILVNYIRKNTLVILTCLLFSAATLGMRWVATKTAFVALFAVDVCMGQTNKSLTQAIVVEFFSTSTRSLALSIMMMLGRIGTLLGNVAFPVLLNISCELPFFLISGIMLSKAPREEKPQTPIQEVSNCLKACKFGRFNIKLLLVTLVGFVSGVAVSNTTSYLLPSAECDLHMTLLQKGILNAMPYLGMLFSSVVAGFLTDTFGRKIFLLLGFGGLFLFTVIAGTSQTYDVLVTAKFFEGLLFASSFSAAVSLSAEFCHNGIRDRIIILQSSFLALAQVIIAAISWAVLIQDWKYTLFGGYIVLNTWNFYLYIMSLWSLASFLMYSCLPESPKYLVMQKEYARAREILINIYKENTGKPADTYPYKNIWTNEIKEEIDKFSESKKETTFSHQIVVGLHNIKPMFRKPLVKYLGVICLINFMTMASYNIIRLWFPQVSTVVEHYKSGDQDLCTMLDSYTDDLKQRRLNTTAETQCVPVRSGAETYINSIIIGSFSMLPYLVTGLVVNRVGKKPLIILSGVIFAVTTIGLRWANSKELVVALFAVDICFGQTIMSMNQAIIVEFFPTTTRSLAISTTMMMGRIGTLLGNIAFPVMLSTRCELPFFVLSGLMLMVVVTACLLPMRKK